MVYADYEFYANDYYGDSISWDVFPKYAMLASAYLDTATMRRAKSNPDMPELKMACCALAEQYQAMDTAQKAAQKSLSGTLTTSGGELSSQSVGGWSKSYRSGGDTAKAALSAAQATQEALYNTVLMYLGGTGLLMARGYMA